MNQIVASHGITCRGGKRLTDYAAALAQVKTYAERVLGDHAAAEDIAQEAVSRLAAGAELKHLGLITYGLVVDEYRRRDRLVPVDTHALLEALAGGVDESWTVESIRFTRTFNSAVRLVPEPERDAFILTELRGLDQRETADVLSTSQPTVHRRAERARQLIREELLSD